MPDIIVKTTVQAESEEQANQVNFFKFGHFSEAPYSDTAWKKQSYYIKYFLTVVFSKINFELIQNACNLARAKKLAL